MVEGDSKYHESDIDLLFWVVTPLSVVPSYVDFGDVEGSKSVSQLVMLRKDVRSQPWDSIKVDNDDKKNINVVISKTTDNLVTLKIALNNNSIAIGRFKGRLNIRLFNEMKELRQEYFIEISENHSSYIHANPPSLFLGLIQRGESKSVIFHIYSSRAIRYSGIKSSNKSFAIGKLLSSNDYALTFQGCFFSTTNTGNQSGNFLVFISDGINPETLKIPFITYIK